MHTQSSPALNKASVYSYVSYKTRTTATLTVRIGIVAVTCQETQTSNETKGNTQVSSHGKSNKQFVMGVTQSTIAVSHFSTS